MEDKAITVSNNRGIRKIQLEEIFYIEKSRRTILTNGASVPISQSKYKLTKEVFLEHLTKKMEVN